MFGEPEDPEAEVIHIYQEEPDWDGIAREAGTTADVDALKPWWHAVINCGL